MGEPHLDMSMLQIMLECRESELESALSKIRELEQLLDGFVCTAPAATNEKCDNIQISDELTTADGKRHHSCSVSNQLLVLDDTSQSQSHSPSFCDFDDESVSSTLTECLEIIKRKDSELAVCHERIQRLLSLQHHSDNAINDFVSEIHMLRSENKRLVDFQSRITSTLKSSSLFNIPTFSQDSSHTAGTLVLQKDDTDVQIDSESFLGFDVTSITQQLQETHNRITSLQNEKEVLLTLTYELESRNKTLVTELAECNIIIEQRVHSVSVRFQQFIDLKEYVEDLQDTVRTLESQLIVLQSELNRYKKQTDTVVVNIPLDSPNSVVLIS